MAVFSFRRINEQWLLIITICFTGLFVRTTNGVCSSVANCNVCADTNLCTSCSLFYGLTNSQPPTCQLCSTNSGCATCSKLSACDVCNNAALGPDTKGVGTCSSCALNCSNCAVTGAGLCDSCITGYTLNINNTCTECSASCTSCSRKVNTNVTSLTCDSCQAGLFVNSTTNMCEPCTDVNCASCHEYYTWLGSQCDICNDGFYPNNTHPARFSASACLRCAASCRTCSGSTAFNCEICNLGFGFASGTRFCAPCSVPFCTDCSDGQNTCYQCQPGYALSWEYPSACTSIASITTTNLISLITSSTATVTQATWVTSMSTPVNTLGPMSMSTPVNTLGPMSKSTPVSTLGPMSMSTPVITGGPMSMGYQPYNSGTMTIFVIILAVLLGLALIGFTAVIVVNVSLRKEQKNCHQKHLASHLLTISMSNVNDIGVPLQYNEGSVA